MVDEIDYLQVYRGDNYKVNDSITVYQPTLNDICNYGEKKYFNMIHTLTSVGADMKWQLDELNIDYTKVSDFDLFSNIISRFYSSKDTSILFGNVIDFKSFDIVFKPDIEEFVLYDEKNDIVFDRFTYQLTIDFLRKMHGLTRNNELPGNEATRRILIDDAKEEYESNKSAPYSSHFLPLISAMVNSPGFKHNEIDVFSMKICPFLDSVKRIQKIKSAELLLQSGYSGFGVNLKDIDKKEIDWIGELS